VRRLKRAHPCPALPSTAQYYTGGATKVQPARAPPSPLQPQFVRARSELEWRKPLHRIAL
jgi:hypothetical protein